MNYNFILNFCLERICSHIGICKDVSTRKKMHLSPIPIFMERMLMISLCFFFFVICIVNAYSMQVESNTLGNVKINADDEEDAVLHKICI